MSNYFFTSESVTEGHPDKICDQISDAVLDAVLKDDPHGACCCEVFITTGLVVVGGEISTKTYVDINRIVRNLLYEIGYTNPDYGIDHKSCAIITAIDEQSSEIAQGEKKKSSLHKKQGAGDQGIMFGYACDETSELMPLPIMLAHGLTKKLADVRRNDEIQYLRPDGKSQVTVEYDENGQPLRVDTVVVAAQHHDGITHQKIKKEVIEKVIKPVCGKYLDKDTKYLVNETGKFVVGGPQADTGLTGRKIIVDTYGGRGRHGGGAFSGKVPNKQDRSGAYMARYIAKNIVAAGYATQMEVQLSYAIGYPEPVSIHVDTFGTGNVDHKSIEVAIRKCFDLTPAGIIKELDLLRPIYLDTATYGHFGKSKYPWEKIDRVDKLRKLLK